MKQKGMENGKMLLDLKPLMDRDEEKRVARIEHDACSRVLQDDGGRNRDSQEDRAYSRNSARRDCFVK